MCMLRIMGRKSMQVTFSAELKPDLETYRTDLQIQGTFVPGKEVLDTYLDVRYGNACDFDQQELWR